MTPPPQPQPQPSSLESHLRRWGLLWVALATAVLLSISVAWVYQGILSHRHELADVHGSFLLSHLETEASLEDQLHRLHPFGAWSLSLLDEDGAVQTAGPATDPGARAPHGLEPTAHGRYLVEEPLGAETLVVEFVPMLANDLERRARTGLLLSIVASTLLVLFVALWTRYRLRLEALTLESERTRHLAHLGTLSAVIAHELRNPLTILVGHVSLLREELPQSRSLQRVEEGAHRLDDLLESLLAFARTSDVKRRPCDPTQLLTMAAADAGVEVRVQRSVREWSLDPTRMTQVFVNLVHNAAQSGPHGPVEVDFRVEDAALVIEVRDHGDGIPEGMHEAIFEPFHTTRTQGTGLGLAVARKIVEAHGGTLSAHDAPGGGALFRARIPA